MSSETADGQDAGPRVGPVGTSAKALRTSGSDLAHVKRQEIITQAAILFQESSYHNTSMLDIAAAVGVRKPTLYHYISSKYEILFGICEAVIDPLLTAHEQRLSTESLTPSGYLRGAIEDILELLASRRGYVRVFNESHRELLPEHAAAIAERWDQYGEMITGLIVDGVATGEMREVNVGITRMAIFGMCSWAYQWFDPAGPLDARGVADAFWDLIRGGLLPDPTPDPIRETTSSA